MGLATRPIEAVKELKPIGSLASLLTTAFARFGAAVASARARMKEPRKRPLKLRQSGFSAFTLERPLELVRSARWRLRETVLPRLRVAHGRTRERCVALAITVKPRLRQARVNVRERSIAVARTTTLRLREVGTRVGSRSRTSGEAVGLWLSRARTQVQGGTRATIQAVVPRMQRAPTPVRDRTTAVVDALRSRLRHGRSRVGARTSAVVHSITPRLRQTQALLRERTGAVVETLVPRLKQTHVQESAPFVPPTVTPPPSSFQARVEQRAGAVVDNAMPRLVWLQEHAMERAHSFEERWTAAKERMKAGVPIWVTLLLVVVTALVAQAFANGAVERRHALETRQLAYIHKAEEKAADARSREMLSRESDEFHLLLGSTIAWTIQNALTRKKPDDIDDYFRELVKNDRMQTALLADNNGKIIASTDPALKGADFAQRFPTALLGSIMTTIDRADDGMKRLVIPIQHFGVRLGTAMLVYSPSPAAASAQVGATSSPPPTRAVSGAAPDTTAVVR
jgi:hypothetical protein